MPAEQEEPESSLESQVFVGAQEAHAIYPYLGEEDEQTGFQPIFSQLYKEAGTKESSASTSSSGTKPHPFDFDVARELVNVNPHHAACLAAKKKSTVGMGFVQDGPPADPAAVKDPRKERRKRSKASKILDTLCRHSLQDVLDDICEDFWATGTGYLEVVRKPSTGETATQGDPISGLFQIPATETHVKVEDPETQDFHYEVRPEDGKEVRMARFGDLDGYVERVEKDGGAIEGRVSELIAFRSSSALSEWYGFPGWLSAISAIELARSLHQFTHDFFQNRAVPEFILAFLRANVSKDTFELIKTTIQNHTGLGNQRKTMVLNIPNPDVEMQVEKLALEGKSDSREFAMLSDAIALEIVTAHSVPPLLAGIQIPGKLGATNELPNALMAFQLLQVGPAQSLFTSTFDCTLGDPELNGGLGLSEGDFILRAITDEIDLGMMDTTSRMREPIAGSGRDPKDGLKKEEIEDLEAALGEGWREVLGEVVSEALRGLVARSKAA